MIACTPLVSEQGNVNQTDMGENSSKAKVLFSRANSFWAATENWSLGIALLAMMALPLIEIVLRQFNTGVYGGSTLLQHLVLFVAMIGSAIAARESRLLSLSTVTTFLEGPWLAGTKVVSASFAFFVASVFCVGSYLYIQQTFDADRVIFPGFPLWAAKTIMPFGFAVISLRLLWSAGPRWWQKLIPLAVAAGLYYVGTFEWEDPAFLVWPLLGLTLFATICGAPIFVTLGGAAITLFWGWGYYYGNETAGIVALNHYDLVKSPMLVTLPLFTLAGYLLAQGNSSQRLIRLIESVFGGVRGSAAIVTVLVCTFFTTFTGASGVTILALGGLLFPILKASGYTDRSSVGLLTGAGSLGVLFPPCLPLILYTVIASTAHVSISLQEIFLGGAIPGALLVGMTIAWGVYKQPKRVEVRVKRELGEVRRAFFGALGELALPVVALLALFSGYATPVEAASVSAFYAFVLYLVDAKWIRKASVSKELPKVMAECGLLVGGVLLILGVAFGFTNYLVTAMVPDQIVDWATTTIESPLLFLLGLNIFLIVVGCLMDIFSAIIVVVPLIVPLGTAFGINPIHLGIIFLANLQLGYLTPPIGMNLFLASYRFNKPMSEVIRASLPMLFVFVVGVLVITYIPALTTWLPSLLEK